jgi:hypothetical protein
MAELLLLIVKKSVFNVIMQMKKNKSLGSDEFPTELEQKCWDIVKGHLMAPY